MSGWCAALILIADALFVANATVYLLSTHSIAVLANGLVLALAAGVSVWSWAVWKWINRA